MRIAVTRRVASPNLWPDIGLHLRLHDALGQYSQKRVLGGFHPYVSEKEAIEAFSQPPQASHGGFQFSIDGIVCLDSSLELLAYVRVLLQRSGYEVFTTQYLSDALTVAKVRQISLVILGPGMRSKEIAIEKFRENLPNALKSKPEM